MSEEIMSDDSSHYEVSLTAGQAFIAFVLLLFSLAASFVFGVMIGRGQVGDRLVVKKEPTIINEGSPSASGGVNEAKIVELGVPEEERPESESNATATVEEPKIIEEAPAASSTDSAEAVPENAAEPAADPQPAAAAPPVEEKPKAAVAAVTPAAREEKKGAAAPASAGPPVYAQVLSTGEARTAESLAARLIDGGFTTAYVERSQAPTGMIYRVRVRFPSEAEARASADRLRAIARTEPWITKQ